MRNVTGTIERIVSAGLVLVVIAGCQRDFVSPDGHIQLGTIADTLNARITPGVSLSLIGLRDIYTLDDTITTSLVLKNNSDPNPFSLHTESLPLHSVRVFLTGSADPVYYFPQAIAFMSFDDTLRIGDSLSFRIMWDGNTWDAQKSMWTGLKAFSGTYQLETWLNGNRLLNHQLTKFITISETGSPLCGALRIDFSSRDSVKAEFIIRNRNSRAIPLDPVNLTPITMALVAGKDTVAVFKYPLASNVSRLPGFFDTVILPFRVAKGDSRFTALKGWFDMRATLQLISGQINASGFRYLP